ncbi:hypothetical protein [Siminovitchia fortis]|nr:hypothetical protein [Siminovitchia fortis]
MVDGNVLEFVKDVMIKFSFWVVYNSEQQQRSGEEVVGRVEFLRFDE